MTDAFIFRLREALRMISETAIFFFTNNIYGLFLFILAKARNVHTRNFRKIHGAIKTLIIDVPNHFQESLRNATELVSQ